MRSFGRYGNSVEDLDREPGGDARDDSFNSQLGLTTGELEKRLFQVGMMNETHHSQGKHAECSGTEKWWRTGLILQTVKMTNREQNATNDTWTNEAARMALAVFLSQQRTTAHVRRTTGERRAAQKAFRLMRCGAGTHTFAREVSTKCRGQDDCRSTEEKPVEPRASSTKQKEETDAHDPDPELTELQLHSQQARSC